MKKLIVQLNTRGFTLVEMLIAVTILVVAITGPFVAVQQALKSAYIARDELIAASLAQEAIEYARGVRDNNYHYNRVVNPATKRTAFYGLNGTPSGAPNCFNDTIASTRCTVDPKRSTNPVVVCTGGVCNRLYLNTTSNLYTQITSGATQTRFTRSVYLTTLNARGDVRVTATVTWSNYGSYTLTVTDVLTDWL